MSARSPQWKGVYGLTLQQAGRKLQLSERVTDNDVYIGPLELCVFGVLRRGTYGTGSRLGWVCTNSSVDGAKGNKGTLTINWEIGGPDANPLYLPLDDFRAEPVELYPKVEQAPGMFGDEYPDNSQDKIQPLTIDIVHQAVKGATQELREQAKTQIAFMDEMIDVFPVGTSAIDQQNFAYKLWEWLDQGIETYYLTGMKYSWIHHSFTFPEVIDRGGYIQKPTGGPLADNEDLSFLRLSDVVEPVGVNGSCFKITSSWLGGPDGHWSETLYPPPPPP